MWPAADAFDDSSCEIALSARSSKSGPWADSASIPGSTKDWEVISAVSSVVTLSSCDSNNSNESTNNLSYRDALLKENEAGESEIKPCCVSRPVYFKQDHEKRNSQKGRNHSGGDSRSEVDQQADDFSAASLFEKPLADKLRKKFEKGGRRRALLGHTGRKQSYIDPDLQTRELCRRNGSTTAIDKFLKEAGLRPRWGTPSLNHHRLWETIPDLLEAESVTPPQHVREGGHRCAGLEGYKSGTMYRLKPVEENSDTGEKPSCWWARSIKDPHTIFHRPCGAPLVHSSKFAPKKVFTTLAEGPPQNIQGNALDWELCSGSRRQYRYARAKPAIRGDVSWDVEKHIRAAASAGRAQRRAILDIDLGATRTLTGIVTQGAPPPTNVYPYVTYYDRKGNCVPRGSCEVEGRLYNEIYRGPFWKVLDPEKPLQWVRKFEVLWRADSGRQWNSLGTFAASWDEKSHPLHDVQGGLYCRYLRFVPIDCENGGALRIGVYGRHPELGSGASFQSAKDPDASPGEDELVEYTLFEPAALKAAGTHERDIFSYRKWRHPLEQRVLNARRKNMKEEARRELEKW